MKRQRITPFAGHDGRLDYFTAHGVMRFAYYTLRIYRRFHPVRYEFGLVLHVESESSCQLKGEIARRHRAGIGHRTKLLARYEAARWRRWLKQKHSATVSYAGNEAIRLVPDRSGGIPLDARHFAAAPTPD